MYIVRALPSIDNVVIELNCRIVKFTIKNRQNRLTQLNMHMELYSVFLIYCDGEALQHFIILMVHG